MNGDQRLGAFALFCVAGFLCWLVLQVKQCEGQLPATIKACHETCAVRGVHKVDRLNCECK